MATGTHEIHDREERSNMDFCVVVFPNGTRPLRDDSRHPLHRGAFEQRDRDMLDPARTEADRWPGSPRTWA